jgi:ornithine cyclodeaminase/alanine dehydrogenase-like protein (mu-crystallin family)
VLILNEQVLEQLNVPDKLIEAIEHAYSLQEKESTYIPDRPHLDYNGNTLLLMPGFIKEVFGTKLISIFPENSRLNKPFIHGLMVINDADSGEPKAILNGSKLTAIRTAAVAATAIKHLSQNGTGTLGIIGAGVQAFHLAQFCLKAFDFERLLICSRTYKKAESLCNRLEADSGNCLVQVLQEPESLVQDSDVIATATNSVEPVFNLPANQLRNKVFIGIGSYRPDMMELPMTLYKAADRIFVDTPFAKKECGDLAVPLNESIISDDQIIPFNRLIQGKIGSSDSSVKIFKSVGMSLFDLTVSEHLYQEAVGRSLGQKIVL